MVPTDTAAANGAPASTGHRWTMWVPFEILQNLLMGIPTIARLAGRHHRTGLNADRAKAREVIDGVLPVPPCRRDTPNGPGHTLEVLEEAFASGAKSCTAVDVMKYLTTEQAAQKGIDCRLYDGKLLPFASRHPTSSLTRCSSTSAIRRSRCRSVSVCYGREAPCRPHRPG